MQEHYPEFGDTSVPSAEVIVPWVIEMIRPQSVVDVGCGAGYWLRAFMERGINDVVGLDGPWNDRETLVIPQQKYIVGDFERLQSTSLQRTFDLAICLEVGEHVSDKGATPLVDWLTSLAPVVLFSAAVPRQRGHLHINCQWPEYWAAKFAARQFECYDCVRPRFWKNPRVTYWYKQNAFLYVRKDAIPRYPNLPAPTGLAPLALVHPEMLDHLLSDMWRRSWKGRLTRAWRAVFGKRKRR